MLLHWRCHPWWLMLAIALLVKPSYPTDSQVSITKFGLYQMATSCKIFCQISDLRVLTAFLVLLLVRITGFLSLLYFSCPDSFHQYGQAMVYLPDTVSEAVHPVVPLSLCPDMHAGLLLSSGMLFAHHTGALGSSGRYVWMAGEWCEKGYAGAADFKTLCFSDFFF